MMHVILQIDCKKKLAMPGHVAVARDTLLPHVILWQKCMSGSGNAARHCNKSIRIIVRVILSPYTPNLDE
jgi:hypothetical protein